MATAGSATVVVSVAETLDTPQNRLGTIFDNLRPVYSWTDGVGASQNDLVWQNRIQIGAGATVTTDLAAGLTDSFGAAVVFVEVTMIAIFNRETVAARIMNFGPNSANNPFLWTMVVANDLVQIPPGGAYIQWDDAGRTVGAGASDELRFINTDAGGTLTYDIIVVGRSA